MVISLPTDDSFKLDDYPLYNLNRTSSAYIDEMSTALRQCGLDQTQWRVLGLLGDKDESSVSDIARRGVIKISTLTRMLERMERDGLVTRKPWAKDRRIIKVKLEEKGRAALQSAYQVGARIYSAAREGISDQEMEAMMDTLKRMRANLQRNQYVAAA